MFGSWDDIRGDGISRTGLGSSITEAAHERKQRKLQIPRQSRHAG
jgi:hypothetical protein